MIETYLSLIAIDFITTMSKQHSKTTRRKLCSKKLGTSHDVLKNLSLKILRSNRSPEKSCCLLTNKNEAIFNFETGSV